MVELYTNIYIYIGLLIHTSRKMETRFVYTVRTYILIAFVYKQLQWSFLQNMYENTVYTMYMTLKYQTLQENMMYVRV